MRTAPPAAASADPFGYGTWRDGAAAVQDLIRRDWPDAPRGNWLAILHGHAPHTTTGHGHVLDAPLYDEAAQAAVAYTYLAADRTEVQIDRVAGRLTVTSRFPTGPAIATLLPVGHEQLSVALLVRAVDRWEDALSIAAMDAATAAYVTAWLHRHGASSQIVRALTGAPDGPPCGHSPAPEGEGDATVTDLDRITWNAVRALRDLFAPLDAHGRQLAHALIADELPLPVVADAVLDALTPVGADGG